MTTTVLRNEAARSRLESWHGRFRERIDIPLESRNVDTAIGPSHVLSGGQPDISFPGRVLADRMSALMPDVETEVLEGSRHRVSTFLEQAERIPTASDDFHGH